jgi:hypothetical protein
MTPGSPSEATEPLLAALGHALDAAPRSVREIEVGIALSIVLGKQRPAVSCGGCKTPLEYRGIPAVTNIQLREPFRLRFAED